MSTPDIFHAFLAEARPGDRFTDSAVIADWVLVCTDRRGVEATSRDNLAPADVVEVATFEVVSADGRVVAIEGLDWDDERGANWDLAYVADTLHGL